MDIFKSDGVSLQANPFPDADRRQLGTPIPAPVTGRLAQVRATRDVTATLKWELGLSGGDKAHGRSKNNQQFIRAFVQKFFDFPFPTPKHIVGMAKVYPVEIDVRKGIEPLTDEIDVLSGEQVRAGCKTTAI